MKRLHIYIIGIAMSLVPTTMWGQGTLSPKAAITISGNGMKKAKAQGVDNKKVSAYITINDNITSWQELGLMPIAEDGNTATVRLSLNELKALAGKEGVEYIQLSSGVQQMLDVARKEAGTDDIHKGTSLPQPYTGKGVVVGIVDAGFDYLHAAFRNPENGTFRIKKIWEQGTTKLEGAKAPEKYGYGIELNTPELIMESQGDSKENSHGTHVAGIAAGSDSFQDGAYVGNAPDADIVLVALDLNTCTNADICNGVKYIFDYADEVGKPCVVNLSLGNHEGPHDGTTTFDTMTDKMQGPGRLIVGAAGNHRTDKFHIDHSFTSADDAPLKTFVDYKLGPSLTSCGGNIEIWGEVGSEFTVDLAAYSTFNKKDMVSTTVYPAEGVTEASFGRYATGTWKVASEISPLNGKPHVVLTSALTNMRNNYNIAITITPKNSGRVNIWADDTYVGLSSKDTEGYSGPDEKSSTLAEIGGTGKRILTVGAYTTRNTYKTNTASGTLEETIGAISSFSSYGPTADGRMKPEITAPGCFIISAVSTNDESGNAMYVDNGWYDKYGHTNIYGYMQGTSMASPFVAGIVATWLQAYPELTPEQLHEIVASTARKDSFTSTEADNNWGYGKINAMEGLKKCIEMQTAGCENIEYPFDGSIKVANNNIAINFPRDTRAAVSVANMAGHLIIYKDFGSRNAGETVNIPMSSLQKGVYLLSVKTGAGTKSYKFVCQ